MDSMTDLVKANPDLITMSIIGQSYLAKNTGRTNGKYDIPKGGHDIYAFKVTDSNSSLNSNKKSKVLMTAGLHAREYAPPELLARFIESLVNGYDEDAEITSIMKRTEIHAILYVNPDGRWVAERYPELMWRKNLNPNGGCGDGEYGVDINRNFDFAWGMSSGASSNACASDYHGKSPQSEPETKALADYSKDLFPSNQRKTDPWGKRDQPFGEENVGIYADIHASGGYVYYPWGHEDSQSPDDEALQALGRKINSFNGYKLWAGGQPDFVYPASGDASDYEYGVMGVASLGFEIGDAFHQNCNRFQDIVDKNLPALVYIAKIAQAPFKEVKGPDILDASVRYANSGIEVSATASDGEMVNAIGGRFSDFRTGDQDIAQVQLYVDVHPDDYGQGDISFSMQQARRRLVSCGNITKKKVCKRDSRCDWSTKAKQCGSGASSSTGTNQQKPEKPQQKPEVSPVVSGQQSSDQSSVNSFNSGEENVELIIDPSDLSTGRHTFFIQATDGDGYKGPVFSMFVDVPQRRRTSLRGVGAP